MTRPVQSISPTDKFLTMALLTVSGVSPGDYSDVSLNDGSINYFGITIKQTFQYVLIDNIGTGNIRICYNKPGYNLSTSVIGSKTLKSGDSLYIEEEIWHLRIYYITPSTVEFVLKSDKDGGS
jgi:hypothetical protein